MLATATYSPPRTQPTPSKNSPNNITLKLPRLHDAQLRIKREARRFNVLCLGRRTGKDVLMRDLLIEPALRGYPVAWFEPSFPFMLEVWPEIVSILRPLIVHKDSSEHRLELLGGGIVKLWSLHSEDAYNTARGKKYKRVVINEAAMAGHLKTAWEEVIRATLTDYEGDAFFGSTPKGRNFFHTLFQWGQNEGKPDWMSWQMPTSANPFISAGEIEAARADLPQRTFAQEYLAQFNEADGSVFRRVRECVYTDPAPLPPTQGGPVTPYAMGVDFGKTHDFTVLTVMDMRTRRVVELDRFNQIDWSYQRERIKAMYHKWQCELVVAESNSIGGPNIEALVDDNVNVFPFQTTNASKGLLIERLVLAIENKTVSYPANETLIGELEGYEMQQTKLGASTYSAPSGGFDDHVMSLALALWGCQ